MHADTLRSATGAAASPDASGWSYADRPLSGPGATPAEPAAESNPGAELDRYTRLAALTLGAEVATVSLVVPDELLFESCIHLPDLRATRRELPLSSSLDRYAIAADRPLVLEDALSYPLYQDNPAVAEGIRAYAGVPLRSASGEVVGALSVSGYSPREWVPAEIEVLDIIAAAIVAEIDLKGEIQRMEREQVERLAAERREALQQLTLGLRHELNNALAGLILETELLSGGGTAYGRYRESVASIQGQVWRIHDVLRRLDDVDTFRTKPYLDRGLMIDLSEPQGADEPAAV